MTLSALYHSTLQTMLDDSEGWSAHEECFALIPEVEGRYENGNDGLNSFVDLRKTYQTR